MASFNLSPIASRKGAVVAAITALDDGGFAVTYAVNDEIRFGFFDSAGEGRVTRVSDTSLASLGLGNLGVPHILEDDEGRLFLTGLSLGGSSPKLIAQPIVEDGLPVGDPIVLTRDVVTPLRLNPGEFVGVDDAPEAAYLLVKRTDPDAELTFSLGLVRTEDGQPKLRTVELETDQLPRIIWLDEGSAFLSKEGGSGGIRLVELLGLDDDPAKFALQAGDVPHIGVGNRLLCVKTTSDGSSEFKTLRLYNPGSDTPVMEVAYGANEGLIGEFVTEIAGVGFAVTILTEASSRVEVYDLDGDLLKSFEVDENVGRDPAGLFLNNELVALDSLDTIRLLTTFETHRQVGETRVDTLKGEIFEFAVELALDGTKEEDLLNGLKLADILRGAGGDDELNGGKSGDDLRGGTGQDELFAGAGDDIAFGDAGDDNIFGSAGADTLDGGSGDDSILESAGANKLSGGEGDDSIRGGKDGDSIRGEGDDDKLNGGDGDDTIEGDSGDDTIFGGAGKDRIIVGDGADEVRGGEGKDRIVVEDGGGETPEVTIEDFRRGEDKIQLKGFSGVSSFGDLAILDAGDSIVITNGGDGDPFVITLEGLSRFTASDVLFG